MNVCMWNAFSASQLLSRMIEILFKYNVCVNVLQISSIRAMRLPSCSSPLFKGMKVARFSASTTPDKQTQVLSSHFAHNFHSIIQYIMHSCVDVSLFLSIVILSPTMKM